MEKCFVNMQTIKTCVTLTVGGKKKKRAHQTMVGIPELDTQLT